MVGVGREHLEFSDSETVIAAVFFLVMDLSGPDGAKSSHSA